MRSQQSGLNVAVRRRNRRTGPISRRRQVFLPSARRVAYHDLRIIRLVQAVILRELVGPRRSGMRVTHWMIALLALSSVAAGGSASQVADAVKARDLTAVGGPPEEVRGRERAPGGRHDRSPLGRVLGRYRNRGAPDWRGRERQRGEPVRRDAVVRGGHQRQRSGHRDAPEGQGRRQHRHGDRRRVRCRRAGAHGGRPHGKRRCGQAAPRARRGRTRRRRLAQTDRVDVRRGGQLPRGGSGAARRRR